MYDHFHAEYEHHGQTHELEGGFTGFPADWKDKTDQDKRLWWRHLCIVWGMPQTAVIKKLWLAR